MEIVGQADDKPFWYQEADAGGYKYARRLYTSGPGAALSVKPDISGSGGATAVVGWVQPNSLKQAGYWSVMPAWHVLYNFGAIYYPNEDSVFTDTDRGRNVGYHGSPTRAFIMDNTVYDLAMPSNATATVAYGMHPYYGGITHIVGSYIEGVVEKPVYWSYTGSGASTCTPLQIPQGLQQARAYAVNDYGQIVGFAWHENGGEVACRWYFSGSVWPLEGSFQLNRAFKVNSFSVGGKVVGFTRNNGGRGFVHTP